MRKARKAFGARFWEFVDKSCGGDSCWPWRGQIAKKRGGYGQYYCAGRLLKAHRTAFELLNGSIEEGLVVLHTCDNPACCNPLHLRVGTHADNVADKVSKRRHKFGSGQHMALLTERDIPIIRVRLRIGESQASIARDFGVCRGAITNIALNKTWRHVE
jgi:hypothetical protein